MKEGRGEVIGWLKSFPTVRWVREEGKLIIREL